MSRRARVSFLLILALLFVGCGSSEATKTRSLGSLTYNDHGTKAATGKTTFALEADSYYFEPTFIQGDAGKPLQLTIKNDSSATHNLSITNQGIDQDIPAKGSITVTVTLPASGAIGFFCKFHTGQGMNGQLLAGTAQPQPLSNTSGPTGSPTAPSTYPRY
jgi:plastocyanin